MALKYIKAPKGGAVLGGSPCSQTPDTLPTSLPKQVIYQKRYPPISLKTQFPPGDSERGRRI